MRAPKAMLVCTMMFIVSCRGLEWLGFERNVR